MGQWSGDGGQGRTMVQPLGGGGKQAAHHTDTCMHTHIHTAGYLCFSCSRGGGTVFNCDVTLQFLTSFELNFPFGGGREWQCLGNTITICKRKI